MFGTFSSLPFKRMSKQKRKEKSMRQKTFFTNVVVTALVALMVIVGSYTTSYGQGKFPARPLTIICPWAAGGGTDAVARMLAVLMEKDLGQPVNMVNRIGGSGAVGHTAAATANPDGYTMCIATVEITMMHWMGLAKVTYQDMKGVALINFDPAAVK